MLDNFWDTRTFRVLFTALVFYLVLAFLHGARETLTLFLFAILFAYFVEPLVLHLITPCRGRLKAIAAVYLILIAVGVGLGFLVGPRLADESRSLMVTLPGLLDRMASGQFLNQFGQSHGWSHERLVQLQTFFAAHRSQILAYAGGLLEGLAAPASHIWWLILIPILSVFFLKDGATFAANITALGKKSEDRILLAGIVSDVDVMLGSYIRAQLILALLTAVCLTIALAIMRVPYAFLLGPLAGICEFVPVVGPAVASAVIFGLGIIIGYPHLFWLFFILGLWRVIQDYINAPRIMGKSLEISPLIEIFGVLAGGEIGGVVGALISVPVIAILRILWQRLINPAGPEVPATDSLPPDSSTHTA